MTVTWLSEKLRVSLLPCKEENKADSKQCDCDYFVLHFCVGDTMSILHDVSYTTYNPVLPIGLKKRAP